MATSINYLKWLDAYFRAAARRASRIEPDDLARKSGQLWNSMQEWPRMIFESSVAQQEIVRRQAQVVQSSTNKSSYVIATLYEFMAVGFLLAALAAGHAWLLQHGGEAVNEGLIRWLAADLYRLLAAAPRLGAGEWLVLILALLFLALRAALLRRRALRKDVPPESRLPVGLA